MSDNELTPEQAADIIRYYHTGENQLAHENGWKEKVGIGKAAARTTIAKYSLLPTEPDQAPQPMLTYNEMAAGLDHIKNPPDPERSEEYYKKLEDLVDKGMTFDEAERKLAD